MVAGDDDEGGAHEQAVARFDLGGRVAWVTGGAGLLGAAVCQALAEHGAHVVVSDVSGDKAEQVAADLSERGLSSEAMSLDVGDEAAVERQAQAILARHERLDVCVNMAFHYTGDGYDTLTTDAWERGMRVTSTGAFLVGRAAGKAMGRGGAIVQFSSMYGVVSPDPQNYPDGHAVNPVEYGVAKAGVLQLVRYQAVMLAPRGVRVNAVVPGPFPYPWAHAQDDPFIRRLSSRVPMGRVGRAPEIAGAVVFLCSPAASYVTGTSLTVDGGWTAW